MIGKIEKNPQLEMFKVPLKHFIKENHELVLLSKKINWEQLESVLGIYYCEDNGRPCIPYPDHRKNRPSKADVR